MKILITGAGGFVGRNLTEALKNIRDGKNRTRSEIKVDEIYLFDVDTDPGLLRQYCSGCDFVFHLAGVNRPKEQNEFTSGNVDFTGRLLSYLSEENPGCPVMLSSSIQASLEGRYAGSAYGESKLLAEHAVFEYAKKTGAEVYVFRLPNLFGKWSRPDYNSVVATFCHRIPRGMPITVNDREVSLELLYIDDLVSILLDCLSGKAYHCRYCGAEAELCGDGDYCYAPGAHSVKLGELADMIYSFGELPHDLTVPAMPEGSFIKKLYSTYLSFLPPEKAAYPLKVNADERGSFTELVKTAGCGQFSVNITRPGVTKGQHWHDSKWELFIVVQGEALIKERRIGSGEVFEFRVSGKNPEAVRMLPGYTHSIQNLSETDDLITLMWANEVFDPGHPDTYFEKVDNCQ
ncbi:MAG: NAD-dependent epimerase/dehydratase family protein [Clostridia bacterium]|nr:NAD-dependent epimerase/dehydratase family protein [Clostridia bacterium]